MDKPIDLYNYMYILIFHCCHVAQLVERRTVNPLVARSSRALTAIMEAVPIAASTFAR